MISGTFLGKDELQQLLTQERGKSIFNILTQGKMFYLFCDQRLSKLPGSNSKIVIWPLIKIESVIFDK